MSASTATSGAVVDDLRDSVPISHRSAPPSISTSVVSQFADGYASGSPSDTSITLDSFSFSQVSELLDVPPITVDKSSLHQTTADWELTSIKQILAWLCNKVEPLLPMVEKVNGLDQKLTDSVASLNSNARKNDKHEQQNRQTMNSKTDKLLAEHKKHIDHLQVQLDNIKQHIPNVTQLHYDRLQNEFDEPDFDSPSTSTNNNFNTLHHQSIDNELLDKLHELDKRLIECEQYSRRENLVISGIPDSIQQKDLEGVVLDILGVAGFCELDTDDIQACHRLGKPRNSRYPARVIVRFITRKIPDYCLSNRDKIQKDVKSSLNLNIRIYENICKMNEESLHICKWLQENGYIHDHFLRNGFVKIVCRAGERPLKVHHPEFLRNKFVNLPI